MYTRGTCCVFADGELCCSLHGCYSGVRSMFLLVGQASFLANRSLHGAAHE